MLYSWNYIKLHIKFTSIIEVFIRRKSEKKENPYDHLNRSRKGIWENLKVIHNFKKKILSELGTEGNFLNLISIYVKPTANITFNGGKLNISS